MKVTEQLAHMKAAHVYAKLSYCKRRQVGCLIVKANRIISIGYNGTPPGWDNICEDKQGNTYPHVYHAEANAISKLARAAESGEGASLFVTAAPCFECAKLIAQVGIVDVFYADVYKNADGIEFLQKCNIITKMLTQPSLSA